jgi:hypothetical protein
MKTCLIWSDLIWFDLIWFDSVEALLSIIFTIKLLCRFRMNWLTYKKNFSSVCKISKSCIWQFDWWTWWKSDLKVVNLMKIRKWWTKNLIKISHTIITWVSISQASADMQENFSSVWQISKSCIWQFDWWTWWKSDLKFVNLMKIKRFESNHWKSEHCRRFWERDYTYTS